MMRKFKEKDLIIKCLRDEATPGEQEMAWNWIHEKAEHVEYYKAIEEAWMARALDKPVEREQLGRSWKNIEKKIKQLPRPIHTHERWNAPSWRAKSLIWSGIAAAVLVAFVLGGGLSYKIFQFSPSSNSLEFYTIEAPRGSNSSIVLADGSTVWLNAGSQLKVPLDFNRRHRDLYLVGEGYFKVQKNEKLGFRVHSAGIVIKALGTEFNVKAYPGEGKIETTLVKGQVSITRPDQKSTGKEIVLKPNEKVSFFVSGRAGHAVTTSKKNDQPARVVDTETETPVISKIKIEKNVNTELSSSWKEKRWVFERESLVSLATMLERQYDVHFNFLDASLSDYHLTGNLEEESLEQVLSAIQLTLPIQFEIKHKQVFLDLDKEKAKKYDQLLTLNPKTMRKE